MAFAKKTWKDRISVMPNRRTIDDGITVKTVTVARAEGAVTEPGDSFNASNMNDLEERIEEGINAVTPREVASATGNPCTFTTDLADNLVSVKANIAYNADGYTEANITRCGVNLVNIDTFNLGDSNPRMVMLTLDKPLPKGTYTISWTESGTASGLLQVEYDGTFIRVSNGENFSANNNVTKLYFYISSQDYSDGKTCSFSNVQLESGTTATAYEPYNGQTYTIAFGQTVYGGLLDVTRGKLRVTWGSVDLGSLDWTYTSTSGHEKFTSVNALSNVKRISASETANAKCSYYTTKSENDVYTHLQDKIIAIASSGKVQIWDSAYSDEQSFKNSLDGVIFAYELATPIDIDLTPVQISALVGTNNITSDLGGDVEVDYYKTVNYKTELSELEDVQITSPSNGQILKFNGTKWVNANGGGGGTPWVDFEDTLSAGSTLFAIYDSDIHSNSTIDIYVGSAFYGVNPTSVTLAEGSITMIFPAQSSAMPVKVRVS